MTTDQIAAEAALSALGRQNPRFNLYRGQDPSFRQADVDFWTSEFKSAIEKALKWQRDYYGYVLPNPQSHASEHYPYGMPDESERDEPLLKPQSDDTKRLDWLEANNATVGRLPSPDMGGNNWYLRTPSIASSKMPRKKSPREAIDDAMSQTKEKE